MPQKQLKKEAVRYTCDGRNRLGGAGEEIHSSRNAS